MCAHPHPLWNAKASKPFLEWIDEEQKNKTRVDGKYDHPLFDSSIFLETWNQSVDL